LNKLLKEGHFSGVAEDHVRRKKIVLEAEDRVWKTIIILWMTQEHWEV
jgi:hypothetical protein